jgi:hypothetical protein
MVTTVSRNVRPAAQRSFNCHCSHRLRQREAPGRYPVTTTSLRMTYGDWAKVLQAATVPLLTPVLNHRIRCWEEPCVKESGLT